MNEKQIIQKEIIPKMSVTIDDKKYKIYEYIKRSREVKGYDTKVGAAALKISEKDYEELEKGNYPINEKTLKILMDIYQIPRKIKRLLQDPNKPEFAKRLTELRIKANKTQRETSEILAIPQPTYSGYETGRNEPDIKTLIKIADLYNVSMDYLTGRY
jgi:transcriptional regulator with XRE-family HTH domain